MRFHRLSSLLGAAIILAATDLLPGLVGLAAPAGAALEPAAASPAAATIQGYWEVAADGGLFTFGGAQFYGSQGGQHLNAPIVGLAPDAGTGGYWEVGADGGIFSYNAPFYGSTGSLSLVRPIVGMAATPDGGGYWFVASDGGIFAYGDAAFHGSMGGKPLDQPIVGMAATADGKGYWLVAKDGGIFAFGDAAFHGSMGGQPLNKPIVGIAADPIIGGYWEVASDGGIFSFNAPFAGSMGGQPLNKPIVAIAADPITGGYWEVASDGGIFAFGNAAFHGSMGGQPLNKPIVGMAVGQSTGTASLAGNYSSRLYGYDVGGFQCPSVTGGSLPSGEPAIGIVHVAGESMGSVNPCLAQEATWAGTSLNLYTTLSYGTQASGPTICGGDQACNYGFAATQAAYGQAVSAGVDVDVNWWLDVETSSSWSSSTTENAQLVHGATLGLGAENVPIVGLYSQLSAWSTIVGTYSPTNPEWVAEYGSDHAPFNPQQYCSDWSFASGATWLVQYTDNALPSAGYGIDGDYAC